MRRTCVLADHDAILVTHIFHNRKPHPSQTPRPKFVILSPACPSAAGSHHAKDLCILELDATLRTHIATPAKLIRHRHPAPDLSS